MELLTTVDPKAIITQPLAYPRLGFNQVQPGRLSTSYLDRQPIWQVTTMARAVSPLAMVPTKFVVDFGQTPCLSNILNIPGRTTLLLGASLLKSRRLRLRRFANCGPWPGGWGAYP